MMIVINGVFLYVVKILMLINILSVVKIDHCARENDDHANMRGEISTIGNAHVRLWVILKLD